jgi:hypothetical protein
MPRRVTAVGIDSQTPIQNGLRTALVADGVDINLFGEDSMVRRPCPFGCIVVTSHKSSERILTGLREVSNINCILRMDPVALEGTLTGDIL